MPTCNSKKQKLAESTYQLLLELASLGQKRLQLRARLLVIGQPARRIGARGCLAILRHGDYGDGASESFLGLTRRMSYNLSSGGQCTLLCPCVSFDSPVPGVEPVVGGTELEGSP